MKRFVERNIASISAAIGALLVVSLTLNGVLLGRVSSLDARVDQTIEDLARVEIGAGLFASQVTALQEQLSALAPDAGEGLDAAVSGLDSFRSSTITFDVAIDEEIPIDAQVLLDRTLEVPIQTTFPIDQVVDTTISIAGPFDTEIPLDVTVPIQLEIPVDLTIPLSINEVVPISADVPVNITVPIAVDVGQTELTSLADALADGLQAFRSLLAGFE
jgi:hypothetical protein